MGNCANNIFVPEEEIHTQPLPQPRPNKHKIFEEDNGHSQHDFQFEIQTLTNPIPYDTQSLGHGNENNWAGHSSSVLKLDSFVFFNPLGIDYGSANKVKGSTTLPSGDIYIGEWYVEASYMKLGMKTER